MTCYAHGTAPGVPGGGPQIWRGDGAAITLAWIESAEGAAGTVNFRIYTPDSRVRVKISLLFIRSDLSNTNPVTDALATLYLGEEEYDYSGARGNTVLCTDILRDSTGAVIHQSAPLPIPEDDGLDGFSWEFVTAADSIFGSLFTDTTGPPGHWTLQVRFQPDGQRLSDEDWDQVKRGCRATVIAPWTGG